MHNFNIKNRVVCILIIYMLNIGVVSAYDNTYSFRYNLWNNAIYNKTSINEGNGNIVPLLYRDSFDDNNEAWTEYSSSGGAWSVSNGMYIQSSKTINTGGSYRNGLNFTDMDILALISVTDNSQSNDAVGVSGRVKGNGVMYSGQYRDASPDVYRIKYYNNDNGIDLNKTPQLLPVQNGWYYYRLRMVDNNTYLKIWENTSTEPFDWHVMTAHDALINGSIGVSNHYASIKIDDVQIREIDNDNLTSKGNVILNYDSGGEIYQIDLKAKTPSNTSYKVSYRNNGTENYTEVNDVLYGNNSVYIGTGYTNIYLKVDLFGGDIEVPELMDAIILYNQSNNYPNESTILPSITNVLNSYIGNTWAIINFTVNQSDALTNIRYSINPDLLSASSTQNQSSGIDRSVNITYLNKGTTYYYSVFAWNASNTSISNNSAIHNFTVDTSNIQAKLYEPLDINITTSNNYNNPYTDVDIYLTANGSAKNISTYGFWNGGQDYIMRISPTETGNWSYNITSNDNQINGLYGTFIVTDNGSKGFIKRNNTNNYSFVRSNGENVLLMGDTLNGGWSNVGGTLNYSTFIDHIDIRAGQKFNYIRGYNGVAYPSSTDSRHYNEGGRIFEPWDPDNINPLYFQEVDKRMAYANSKGITMNLVIGGDGTIMTDFFGWNNGKMERYVKYIAARYSAYDISWEGRKEFEEQGSTTPGYMALANQIGNWLEIYDPYSHVQSVHTVDSNNELGNQPWLDWIMHQSRTWSLITSDRSYNKPVMNEEFYYENSGAGATHPHHVDADTLRKGAWQVMTSGASGLAYGNTGTYNSVSQPFDNISYATSLGADYMTYLYIFWSNINYWNLAPNNDVSTNGLTVTDLTNEYVIYLKDGGSTYVNLSAIDNNTIVNVTWYNPRDANYYNNSTVNGSTNLLYSSPDSNDWILYLKSWSNQ